MLKKIFYLCGAILWLLQTSADAADHNILQTKNTTVQLFRSADDEIVAKFTLAPNWHIYWQNPGEVGRPTTISAQNSQVEVVNQSIPTIRTAYEIMEEYLYENTAYFSLHASNPDTAKISFDFVECNDICKPERLTFNLSALAVSDKDEWQKINAEAQTTFPQKITLVSPLEHNELQLPIIETDDVSFIPAQKDIIETESVAFERQNDNLSIKWTDAVTAEKKLDQALIITPEQTYLAKIQYQSENWMKFVYILSLAFIGGITLNAMPCVFPILSLKIFALLKQRKKRHKQWGEAIGYTAGVFLCFMLLTACIVYLKKQGEAIGWGFQLQSSVFVGIMMVVFFILFLYMMEWLHFPMFKSQIIHRLSGLNAFSTGFFAVLVASPCTGPFMGAAVGYAFMHSTAEIYGVFTALALGYALPYALIELYPQTIKKIIPKPGKWMTKIKIILAVPLLLTSLWLGSILYKQILHTTENKITSEITWQVYDAEKISDLNNQQQNIFIEFTADWCLTCKFNEKILLQSEKFKNFVKENNVQLFLADLTDDNDTYLQALSKYGRSSIPTYIYYTGGSYKVLPIFFSINSLTNQ